MGHATPYAIPIVFTPGGQSGISDPDKYFCLHPTRFVDKNKLYSEYIQNIPTSNIYKIAKSFFSSVVCPCGLLQSSVGVICCSQRDTLAQLLHFINKNHLPTNYNNFSQCSDDGNTEVKIDDNNFTTINENNIFPKYFLIRWDRRNCGGSDFVFSQDMRGEAEHQVDDLLGLLTHIHTLRMKHIRTYTHTHTHTHTHKNKQQFAIDEMCERVPSRAVLIGNSSGARMTLLFAVRHPEHTLAIVVKNITAGPLAVSVLCESYYRIPSRLAASHGSLSLSEKHFGKSCREFPHKHKQLAEVQSEHVVNTLNAYADWMERGNGEHWPTVGISSEELRQVSAPSLVVHSFKPNDGIHTEKASLRVSEALGCEFLSTKMEDLGHWMPLVVSFIKKCLNTHTHTHTHTHIHTKTFQTLRENPLEN
eukprot:GHVR01068914.1.p1 GENE.GHVR01068914.1~~GHVR01068914.1.p1  ORF type:complete len:479 (+),score=155.93 GHVR01068914.1:183-1439(+)